MFNQRFSFEGLNYLPRPSYNPCIPEALPTLGYFWKHSSSETGNMSEVLVEKLRNSGTCNVEDNMWTNNLFTSNMIPAT